MKDVEVKLGQGGIDLVAVAQITKAAVREETDDHNRAYLCDR